jgi:tetratricopeptide (TPR) repeat protein
LAYKQAGDSAGAEVEFRETVKRMPEYSPARNSLGILLYAAAKFDDAAAEFRLAARTDPKNASAHFYLAESLQKLGDRAAALEEYKVAVELAPTDATYKKRYEQAAETPTIRVDVRQVLVPVVVTDKQGHYITRLRKEDFKVFEDGVEQDITAFNVESVPAAPADESSTKIAPEHASVDPKPARIRRTYVICIDTLHTDFGHFVWARKALEKFFGQEQAGDSQYALIALGRTAVVVQNVTRDPALILGAIQSPKFQSAISSTNAGAQRGEMDSYRRELNEVRAACDAGDRTCPSGMKRVESEAAASPRKKEA